MSENEKYRPKVTFVCKYSAHLVLEKIKMKLKR